MARTLALLLAVSLALGTGAAPPAPQFISEDLTRFWAAWDSAGGPPDAATLERLYLKPGSQGLKDFTRLRIESAEALAKTIARHPEYYAGLRQATAALPAAEREIAAALERMHALYPKGRLPPTYFLIGRMNSGGTTSDAGLLIGLEMYGKQPDTDMSKFGDWHRSVLAGPELLPAIVVHELVHTLQPAPRGQSTLLEAMLREGLADLITERAYGRHINAAAHAWGMANECALWRELEPKLEGSDYTGYLYGGQPPERPADLGYFIGYRIGAAWLARNGETPERIAALIESRDAKAFLKASGYAPCR